MDEDFQYTNNWFGSYVERIWEQLIPQMKPSKILEIGSFEGRSTNFLIQKNTWCNELEIHCIDNWKGGIEHKNLAIDMPAVEERFDNNIALAKKRANNKTSLIKLKGDSHISMAKLLVDGYVNYFDFVYIDGSHQAPDVLLDAAMAFKLTKLGGVIGFDDYIWVEDLQHGNEPLRCPKIAIDAFTNIYFRKIRFLTTPILQVYVQKISD